MTESVLDNPIFVRSCILYEALHRKPIDESYKNFCEKLGDDVMDYVDFEFWFYRFYGGNHDLNDDRMLEFKSLSDLPIEIFHRILNELDFRDRMILHKVSQTLRSVVGDFEVICHKEVSLRLCRDWSILNFSHHNVKYQRCDGGCMVKYEDVDKGVPLGDQLELALHDLSNSMKHPKLQLNSFAITFSSALEQDARKKVIETFHSWKWPRIRNFTFNGIHQSEIKTTLGCLNSEAIQTISLDVSRVSEDFVMNTGVYSLEQWKRAKSISICGDCKLSIPFANLAHLAGFEISLKSFTREYAVEIKNYLDNFPNKIQSGTFRSIITDPIEIGKVFNPDYALGSENSLDYNTSNFCYTIQCGPYSFRILRKADKQSIPVVM